MKKVNMRRGKVTTKVTPQEFVQLWMEAAQGGYTLQEVAVEMDMNLETVRARARAYRDKWGVKLPGLLGEGNKRLISAGAVAGLNQLIADMGTTSGKAEPTDR
jgi:guanyl-specific ribonuclease Sa